MGKINFPLSKQLSSPRRGHEYVASDQKRIELISKDFIPFLSRIAACFEAGDYAGQEALA
ncbi:MAG: hypothetical protein ABII93_02175 [Chrysiogenia bacterium]